MKGLDKAIEEVQAVRNRVARLYGMGRISREAMLSISSKADDLLECMSQYNEEVNPYVERRTEEEEADS